jgi:FkbM family methyltransferase
MSLTKNNPIEIMRKGEGCVIWGTGRTGKHAGEICKKFNIPILSYCDSFEHKSGESFEGFPLISGNCFFNNYSKSTIILIACSSIYEIDKKLIEKNYNRFMSFVEMQLLNSFSGFEDGYREVLLRHHEASIENIYDLLSDDKSKKTIENLLKYRMTLDLRFVSDIYCPNQYFDNDIISSFEGDAFIDCGAFTGDTLLRFHDSQNCSCNTYYALEPSDENFDRLLNVIDTHDIQYARPLKLGDWRNRDELCFIKTGMGSDRLSETGNYRIQVNSIDNIAQNQQVDFIKMDIEGAEKEALLGAAQTIKKHRPVLAVSVYHKFRDFWELPLLIKEIQPAYKFYFRHHSRYVDDTICYAF